MITKQDLKKNYSKFSDSEIRKIANDPTGLRPEALEILKDEVQKRNLDVKFNEYQDVKDDKPEFEFEISIDLRETHKDAIKIFGTDEKTISKICQRMAILGCVTLLLGLKFKFVFLIVGLIAFSIYYLQKNIKKFAVMVIYKDKILFKQQRYFGDLRILNFLYLYGSNKFHSIEKKDLINVVMPQNFSRIGELYFETTLIDSKIYSILNVDKKYLNHIYIYLENYIKQKK